MELLCTKTSGVVDDVNAYSSHIGLLVLQLSRESDYNETICYECNPSHHAHG